MDKTILSIIFVIFTLGVVNAQLDGIVIKTTQGWIEGVPNGSVRKFLGIPYAHPPVGDLRWKRPYASSSWGGILKTQKFGSACSQLPNSLISSSSEDCLYLNVFTPSLDIINGSSLPVMMFIHGGCWVDESSSVELYNGEFLVANNKNVIVVSINYRLGPFGFLGGSFLAKESTHDVDPAFHGTNGNYGLQDQRLAMQWVKENIAAFGGNPDKVTIFGQSAGSGSIACHMVMENSWGNFDQAIMESGPIADWTARTFEIAENQFTVFATSLGCYNENDPTATLACLRVHTTEEILTADNGCTAESGCCWYPVIDSVDLKDRPDYVAAAGTVNPVPVMLGTNKDEETMFLEIPYNYTSEQYVAYIHQTFGEEAENVLKLYPPPKGGKTAWWTLDSVGTDQAFVCPARRTARWFSDAFQSKSSDSAEVFLYYWTHTISDSLRLDPATRILIEEMIPTFLAELTKKEYEYRKLSIGAICKKIHIAGINLRYLGVMRRMTDSPLWKNILLLAMIARAAKSELRKEWRSIKPKKQQQMHVPLAFYSESFDDDEDMPYMKSPAPKSKPKFVDKKEAKSKSVSKKSSIDESPTEIVDQDQPYKATVAKYITTFIHQNEAPPFQIQKVAKQSAPREMGWSKITEAIQWKFVDGLTDAEIKKDYDLRNSLPKNREWVVPLISYFLNLVGAKLINLLRRGISRSGIAVCIRPARSVVT